MDDSMRSALRSTLSLLFLALVAPLALPVRWTRRVDRHDHIFRFGSQFVSLVPGLLGVYVRRAYYLTVLPRCGRDVVIEFGTILAQRDTEIGERVYIGAFCNVGTCRIGNEVLVGSNVDIISGRHVHYCDAPDVPIRDQGGIFEKISIGEGSWLGNRSIVMAEVGSHCVIGAGAVVIRPCEDYTVYAGNPARPVRSRLKEPDTAMSEERLRRARSA